MVVPNQERTDNTRAIITLGLDGTDTHHWKTFKCAVCGYTVFRYKDNLLFELPIDTSAEYGQEEFKKAQALDMVECTHFVYNPNVRSRQRCQTTYILLRGNFEVVNNG